jgi:hypothetical protein
VIVEVDCSWELDSNKEFDQCHAHTALGHTIPLIDVEGYGPQVKPGLARPMDDILEHHGASQ